MVQVFTNIKLLYASTLFLYRAIVDCRPESLEYYYEGIKDTFSLYENLSSTPEFTYEVAGPNVSCSSCGNFVWIQQKYYQRAHWDCPF